jgi:UbiA prenyltransferase family protein
MPPHAAALTRSGAAPNLSQAMRMLTEDAPSARPEAARAAGGYRGSTAHALLVAMRPGEWIKNVLVFAGLVFAKKFNEPAQVADALFTFIAFCAISSAGYLFNDLGDVELDRRHPDKRHRPIASGALAPNVAWAAAGVLAVAAILIGLVGASLEVAGLVALYGVATVAYSLGLKRLVIIDVMTIASLFILRVVAGAVAVEAHASPYLLVCTGMLALFLGFTKRRQEAILEADPGAEPAEAAVPTAPPSAAPPSAATASGAPTTRPVLEHYSIPFLDQMVSLVTASAIVSYVIYAINSPHIGSKMLATLPSVLYGIFRYLYLIYDRRDTRSTAAILIEDPGMVFAAVTWVVTAVVMLYAVG